MPCGRCRRLHLQTGRCRPVVPITPKPLIMLEDQQLEQFINEIADHYGYDFGGYSRASFKRRLERIYSMDGFVSFQEFLYRIKTDVDYLTYVIEEITVNVTEMFRDPSFYKVLREEILPVLRSKPFIRIWHAGPMYSALI
eukprot:Opistho-2@60397